MTAPKVVANTCTAGEPAGDLTINFSEDFSSGFGAMTPGDGGGFGTSDGVCPSCTWSYDLDATHDVVGGEVQLGWDINDVFGTPPGVGAGGGTWPFYVWARSDDIIGEATAVLVEVEVGSFTLPTGTGTQQIEARAGFSVSGGATAWFAIQNTEGTGVEAKFYAQPLNGVGGSVFGTTSTSAIGPGDIIGIRLAAGTVTGEVNGVVIISASIGSFSGVGSGPYYAALFMHALMTETTNFQGPADYVDGDVAISAISAEGEAFPPSGEGQARSVDETDTTDQFFEVDVLSADPGNQFELFVREDTAGGADLTSDDSIYLFAQESGGDWYVFLSDWQDGSFFEDISGVSATLPATWRVEVQGDEVRAYVDEVLILTADCTGSAPSGKHVGFWLSMGESQTLVIDNAHFGDLP